MSGLRLFLDSADTRHWQTWLPSGLFYDCRSVFRRTRYRASSRGF